MPRQESVGSIKEWVRNETTHIDVVASWESLNDTYDALRFTDPLSDAERLEEYRWIIQQMNTFLTKIRNLLLSCRNMEAMLEALGESLNPKGKVELGSRKSLVYQKLRQQWIRTAAMRLQTMQMQEDMEEENGWTDSRDA